MCAHATTAAATATARRARRPAGGGCAAATTSAPPPATATRAGEGRPPPPLAAAFPPLPPLRSVLCTRAACQCFDNSCLTTLALAAPQALPADVRSSVRLWQDEAHAALRRRIQSCAPRLRRRLPRAAGLPPRGRAAAAPLPLWVVPAVPVRMWHAAGVRPRVRGGALPRPPAARNRGVGAAAAAEARGTGGAGWRQQAQGE